MKKLLTIVGLFSLLISCQDVIELDTNTRPTTLVVQGRVTDTLGTSVKVSLTAGYFEQGATPVVNDAVVRLYENGILAATLTRDTIDGGYLSAFNGRVGNKYEVEIEVPNNSSSGFKASTWRSMPEEMNRIFEVDSFKIVKIKRPRVFTTGLYAVCYFQEPIGKGDNFRFRRWKNDSLLIRSITTFDDDFFDGLYFRDTVIGKDTLLNYFDFYGPFDEDVDFGDSAGIEFSSISKAYSDFLALINEQSFQVGGPFAAPPAAVIGNIYNVDKPEEIGFGYFNVSAISRGGVTYKP